MVSNNNRKRKLSVILRSISATHGASMHHSGSLSSTSLSEPLETLGASSNIRPSGPKYRTHHLTPMDQVELDEIVQLPLSNTRSAMLPSANSLIRTPVGPLSSLKHHLYTPAERQKRPLDHLISTLPPLLPEFDLDEIAEYLVNLGDLVHWGDNYVWNELKETPTDDKNTIYNETLVNVLSAIIHAAKETSLTKPSPEPTMDLITNVSYPPWSLRKGAINPRGYLVLRKSKESKSKRVVWYDIAACIEFNEYTSRDDDSEVCHNVSDPQISQKSIRNMQHALANDPTRRYMYGISVKGTNLKLWLATRASIISCDSFDFRTKYRDLIRIFLSLSFASRESLGWDTTDKFELEEDDNRRCYNAIADEYHHTDETYLISGDTANTLVDPDTRVLYSCGGPEECGDKVFIEDHHFVEERKTEDSTTQITKDINNLEKEYFKEHALSALVFERGHVFDTDESTGDTILCGQSPNMSTLYDLSQNDTCFGTLGISNAVITEPRGIAQIHQQRQQTHNYHRRHHRIVYKEVAIPHDKLTNTKDMYIVLVDVLKTLLIMHEAGWVHRDISVGNIYFYVDPKSNLKRGLIGDFSYAKRIALESKYDIRTGTPNFLAIEVASRSHQFMTPKLSNADLMREYRLGHSARRNKGSTDGAIGGFIYSNLHDLESLWWILVWSTFIYEKAPASNDENSINSALGRKDHYISLFPGYRRRSFLVDGAIFDEIISQVPVFFLKQKRVIDVFRELLINSYVEAEKDITKPAFLSKSNSLHELISEVLLNERFENFEVISIFNRSTKNETSTAKGPSDMDILAPASKRIKTE